MILEIRIVDRHLGLGIGIEVGDANSRLRLEIGSGD